MHDPLVQCAPSLESNEQVRMEWTTVSAAFRETFVISGELKFHETVRVYALTSFFTLDLVPEFSHLNGLYFWFVSGMRQPGRSV